MGLALVFSAPGPSPLPHADLIALTLVGLLVFAFVVYLYRDPLLLAIGCWWTVNDTLEVSQAIVVLGGDSERGDRVRHAAGLYRAGWAPVLVFSGTPLRTYLNEGELMEREAVQLGVPRHALLVFRHNAYSTFTESLEVRAFLLEHNLRKITIVTSNYHTRRARRIYHEVMRASGIDVRVHAAPDPNFQPADWWKNHGGCALFFLEMAKMVNSGWALRHSSPTSQTSGKLTRELGKPA